MPALRIESKVWHASPPVTGSVHMIHLAGTRSSHDNLWANSYDPTNEKPGVILGSQTKKTLKSSFSLAAFATQSVIQMHWRHLGAC